MSGRKDRCNGAEMQWNGGKDGRGSAVQAMGIIKIEGRELRGQYTAITSPRTDYKRCAGDTLRMMPGYYP